MEGSREGFLSSGLIMADFRAEGKIPEEREELMREVRKGDMSEEMDCKRDEGMGSRGQEVARADWMILRRLSEERGEKEDMETGGCGEEEGV